MRACALFLLCVITAAAAGPLSFGVKGGIPLTDFFSAVNSQSFSLGSNTKHYIVGPTLELHLPAGFGIEVDALYRRMSYGGSSATVSATSPSSVGVKANGFEFPLLAKYTLRGKLAGPFVDAGYAFDTLSGLTQTVASKTGLSSTPPSGHFTKGFVMGGGLDLNLKLIHVTPEIRYTHWGSSRLVDPYTLVKGSQNQGEFLLGITF